MNKQLLFLALLNILSIKSYSQIVFENGYFINESDQKIECLIKNNDWPHNPNKFDYKLSQNEAVQKATIQTVKEFEINGFSKYTRAIVKIDRPLIELNNMSSDRNPNFKEEQLFLKVLVEGKASLFLYNDGNVNQFFFKVNDSEIKQLVYKCYLINRNIAENNLFRQQLFQDLKCQKITSNDVNNIKYNQNELKRFFVKYNECSNSSYINYKPTQKKHIFNLSLRPGLNYSSLTITSQTFLRTLDFGNKKNFRFGIETEYILPFNKNKWSIIIEPTYQYYKSEKITRASGYIVISNIKYHSIELPIGVRHYFFLNNGSKIFANISYIYDFTNNSSIKLKISDNYSQSLDLKSKINLGLGLGYKYKDKYSLEMRYLTSRQILAGYMYWGSDYKTISIIFGYSLF